MIVQEGEQVAAPAGHHRSVQDVAGPQLVGLLGLEPAEGAFEAGRAFGVQPEPGEVALQVAGRGGGSQLLFDDRSHLGGGVGGPPA
jgi:hypothetical protein